MSKKDPTDSVRVAVVQMDTRDDLPANLLQVEALVARAARRNAQFVLLPENTLYIGPDSSLRFSLRAPEIRRLAAAAARHKVWLLVGSVQERIRGGKMHYNTSLLYDPRGLLVAKYRKIHLFRCKMPDGKNITETATRSGKSAVVAATPFGKVGLTICYDLRMPELFGKLVRKGAQMICVPSNFTAFTGKHHWHTLLRARAIENQCYILAPAQCGRKHNLASYGHALIIDPWGKIISEADHESPGMVIANLNLKTVNDYRSRLPSLQDRFRELKEI